MRYNLLWIDDQFDDQMAFIAQAADYGINISAFKTSQDGLNELENNLHFYDAVLLDAKVYNQTENEVASLKGLTNSITRLNQIQHLKHFPAFVFTGQPDLFSNIEFKEMLPELVNVYKKGIDTERLLDEIKVTIDKLPETIIRVKHKDVFEIFKKDLLDFKTEALLIETIQELDQKKVNLKKHLTNIRSIQEAIYSNLSGNKFKIIPKNLDKFNQIKHFLDGNPDKTNGHKPTTQVYQNSTISNISNTIYWVCGQYIHHLDDQEYQITNYTINALLNGLMELLLWYKQLALDTLSK